VIHLAALLSVPRSMQDPPTTNEKSRLGLHVGALARVAPAVLVRLDSFAQHPFSDNRRHHWHSNPQSPEGRPTMISLQLTSPWSVCTPQVHRYLPTRYVEELFADGSLK
jgi:hypothetical protein